MTLRSSLAIGSVLVATGAFGQSAEPPRWSTKEICDRVASAASSIENREQCEGEQGNAYREVQAKWSTYPADLRTRCTEEAGLGGIKSYVELAECINLGVLSRQNQGKDQGSLRLNGR